MQIELRTGIERRRQCVAERRPAERDEMPLLLVERAIAMDAADATSERTNPRSQRTECERLFVPRSEEHTSDHPSLMRISYAGLGLKKKKLQPLKRIEHADVSQKPEK